MKRQFFDAELEDYVMDFYKDSGNVRKMTVTSDGGGGVEEGWQRQISSSSVTQTAAVGPSSSSSSLRTGGLVPAPGAPVSQALAAALTGYLKAQNIEIKIDPHQFSQWMAAHQDQIEGATNHTQPAANAGVPTNPSMNSSQSVAMNHAQPPAIAAGTPPKPSFEGGNPIPNPPLMGAANVQAFAENIVPQLPEQSAPPAMETLQGEGEGGASVPDWVNHLESEKTKKSIFGKRKAKLKGDPESDDFRKRPRNTYTDEQKKFITNAYEMGGSQAARTVADSMGMKWNTAKNIIHKFRKGEAAAAHDLRQGNKGRKSKITEEHMTLIHDMLQADAGHTRSELRNMLNSEILRGLLLEVLPKYPNLFNQEEMDRLEDGNPDINEWMKKAPPEVLHKFQRDAIKSETTIGVALANNFFTCKTIVKEKASVNSKISMEKRLKYCKYMEPLLESKNHFLIFQDEMPFYFTMMRTKGWAKKGERAVTMTPPVSNMSYRTQVSMAVSPDAGLILGKAYLPEKSAGFNQKTGLPKKEAWKTSWSGEKFMDFMRVLLEKLFEFKEQYELKGKAVGIVVDGAPDHGGKELETKLSKTEEWKTLEAFLKQGAEGAWLKIIPAPPNSPQLNLCEYYNRTLRMKCNAIRHQPEFSAKLLGDYQHGEKMQNRVEAMSSIINSQLQALRTSPIQSKSVLCMKKFFREVRKNYGYLDWRKRMG